jgi:hypothetical protein
MFDKHMLVEDGFQNEAVGGKVVGYSLISRLPYYRGLGLSMVEDIALTVDGVKVPRDHISFSVRGRTWRLDELETEYGDRWNFGEKAKVSVKHPGGLEPGKHRVEMTQRMRISYLPFVPMTSCTKELVLE